MEITIKYSYDPYYTYPYHATSIYDNRRLVGVSKKSFDDAKQTLLEAIVEKANPTADGQIPGPKEIEI